MTQHATRSPSGISLTQRILGPGLLIIALVIILLLAMGVRLFNASIQEQADALGTTLITHTAQAVAPPLALSDSLALAAVLRELVNNPYVVHAVLYSVDNRTLAEAGQRPRQGKINSLYTSSIAFEQVIAGQLHISIDVKRLQQPLYGSLQGLLLLGTLMLLAALFLLARLARSISQPLLDLQHWLTQPVGPAPHQQRGDEIGLLARTLDPCFNLPEHITDDISNNEPPSEEDSSIPETPATETAGEPGLTSVPAQHCAVLAIELGINQGIHELDEQRREQLMEHYDEALAEVAVLYQGRLLELDDSRALLLFHDDEQEQYVASALCAAELLRAFVHALQMEVADSGASLAMQLGVAHGDCISDLGEDGLTQHAAVSEALELARHSRNLVLLGQSVAVHEQAVCASIRNISRPAGASCIERMLPPHPEQLDEQLQGLMLLMLDLDD